MLSTIVSQNKACDWESVQNNEQDCKSTGTRLPSTIISAGGSPVEGCSRYLVVFRHRLLDFRIPEFEALSKLVTREDPRNLWEAPSDTLLSPFWHAYLESDSVAEQIAHRSMLTRLILEPWGEGGTLEELIQSVSILSDDIKAPYQGEHETFKFCMDAWGQTASMGEQLEIINRMAKPTGLRGQINLGHPKHIFWIFFVNRASDQPGLPRLKYRWYCGRQVGVGGGRGMGKYALPSRRYLGPTSMDPELAHIMCNQALIKTNSLVIDPFVGTGSILIAAAHYGAHVFGSDIDIRVLLFGKKDKRGQSVNIMTNFDDYGLHRPTGILLADLTLLPLRKYPQGLFDAIICDPPYGVRAGGKRLQSSQVLIKDRETHIPSKAAYTLGECLRDVVEFAAEMLCVGGRLVYWVPAVHGHYFESELPSHPCLITVSNSEQILNTKYSRRLVTMEKKCDYDAAISKEHWERRGLPCARLESLREVLFESNSKLPKVPIFRGKQV